MLSKAIKLVSVLLFFPATGLADPLPPIKEVEDSINSIKAARGGGGDLLRILAVEGCYPSNRAKTYVCLIRGTFKQETTVQEVPIEKNGETWKVLDPNENSVSAVCPNNDEATKLLRALKGRSDIVVVGEVDGGLAIFSDQRGLTRNKKGPMRLMCRFNVNDSIGDDRLYLSYVGFYDGKYFIDPDIELAD